MPLRDNLVDLRLGSFMLLARTRLVIQKRQRIRLAVSFQPEKGAHSPDRDKDSGVRSVVGLSTDLLDHPDNAKVHSIKQNG